MPAFNSVPATVSAALLMFTAAVAPARAQSSGKEIGATGTIEPRGGVVMLSGVGGALIKDINVSVGQTVKAGDVLMVLDDRDASLQTSLDRTALEEARRHAVQQIAESNQSLALAQAKADRAEQDAKAYKDLGPDSTSQMQIESMEAAVRDAHAALASEQRRNVQVKADSAEDVASASKRYKFDRTRLATYKVTAPSPGVVLQVTQHVGEVLGGPPIAIGDISAMYVTCDAFQGDLLKPFSRACTRRVEQRPEPYADGARRNGRPYSDQSPDRSVQDQAGRCVPGQPSGRHGSERQGAARLLMPPFLARRRPPDQPRSGDAGAYPLPEFVADPSAGLHQTWPVLRDLKPCVGVAVANLFDQRARLIAAISGVAVALFLLLLQISILTAARRR